MFLVSTPLLLGPGLATYWFQLWELRNLTPTERKILSKEFPAKILDHIAALDRASSAVLIQGYGHCLVKTKAGWDLYTVPGPAGPTIALIPVHGRAVYYVTTCGTKLMLCSLSHNFSFLLIQTLHLTSRLLYEAKRRGNYCLVVEPLR